MDVNKRTGNHVSSALKDVVCRGADGGSNTDLGVEATVGRGQQSMDSDARQV